MPIENCFPAQKFNKTTSVCYRVIVLTLNTTGAFNSKIAVSIIACRDVISVFSREGQNFDQVSRREQKLNKTKFWVQKHKNHYFSKSEGGGEGKCTPPQMTSLIIGYMQGSKVSVAFF